MSARPKASDKLAPAAGSAALGDAVPVRTGLLADHHFVEARFGGSGGQGVVLMGIILINACEPARETLEKAEAEKIPILVSDLPAFELSGRIYNLLTSGS